MAAAIGLGRFAYTPALPFMTEALGFGQGDAGLIASANFAGYLGGAVLAARTMSRNGRAWLVAALCASAATTLAMGLANGFAVFILLRVLGGVASAVVLVISSHLVLDRLRRQGRRELAAVHFGGVGFGIAAMAALVAAMASLGEGWRSMWIGAGALSFVAAASVWVCVGPDDATGLALDATTACFPPSWRFRLLALAYGLFGYGYVITATFLIVLVRQRPDARAAEALVWTIVGVAAMPSVLAWSAVARRVGALRAAATAALVEACGVALSATATGLMGLCVAAALLGGTFMGMTALGLIAATEEMPAASQRIFGVMTAAFSVGQMLGPSAAGPLHDATGSFFLPTMSAAGALCLAATIEFALAIRRRGPTAAAETAAR